MKKKAVLTIVAIVLCAGTALAQKSKIVTDSVSSSILGKDVSVNIYLPAGFDNDATRQYPVIYLLHGLYGVHTDWDTRGHMKEVVDELMARGEVVRSVIIMPCAGDPDVHHVLNGYFNVPERRYEDFFFKELIPALEKRYRVKADKQHRAIMGLSMGGGGSTVYAQRHPDMFSSCYAMSAWLDTELRGTDPKDKLYVVSKSVHENSAIRFVENADEATVARLKTVSWFFDCGDDDYLLDLSVDIYQKMRGKGIKAELRVRDGWHSWEYWHSALRLALPFASNHFGDPESR
ncbi:MAG: esterase family protein [Bacteroidales bacterium]|nr:esterase family protein [Bacteroidales bacterium]